MAPTMSDASRTPGGSAPFGDEGAPRTAAGAARSGTPQPADLVPGDVVGGYTVLGLVGRGGMGAVYRARDAALGRQVALKVIAPALARDPRFRERFIRESRIAARLEHPHIVPVYGADEDAGRLFIAMRLIDGVDLAELLRRGRLDPGRAAGLVAQVADALDAAHRRGLVHRDVKPANVLITGAPPEEFAYLTDFGLTTEAQGTGSGLTQTGGWVGSLAYVAPEQIRGGTLDARTDVYALGAVLHECLTGTPPFAAGSEMQALAAHLAEPPPRPSDRAAPAAFDDVVARAMAKDPAARHPSAGDLGRAALAAAGGRSPAGRRRLPRRRFVAAIAVAVVIAVVAATVALALLRDGSGSGAAAGRSLIVGTGVRVGTDVVGLARGEGGLWAVAEQDDTVVIVPVPADGAAPSRSTAVNPWSNAVVAATGPIWIAALDPGLPAIQRVDPVSLRIVGHADVDAPVDLAVLDGAAWVLTRRAARGTLSRLDPTSGRPVVPGLPAGRAPRRVTDGFGAFWVTDASTGVLLRIDPDGGTVAARIPVGRRPDAVVAAGSYVWIADRGDGALLRVDPARNQVVGAAIAAGDPPLALAASGGDLWVADAQGRVVRRDAGTGGELGVAQVAGPARDLEATDRGVVVASGDGTVHTILRGPSA